MRRTTVLIGPVLALLLAVPGHAGPNLLVNPGFEQSAFGSAPDTLGAAGIWQPLLPTGWAFEGSAGLFDHGDQRGSGGTRTAHGGNRFGAISIPASGKPRVCTGVDPSVPNQCADLGPVSGAKATASVVYSADPVWRNASPVAVTGETTYTLSYWATWQLLSSGSTVFSKVRWLNASGVAISVSPGTSTTITPFTENRDWTSYSQSVTSPGAARQAVVLFGVADDAFIGSIGFDDVSFG